MNEKKKIYYTRTYRHLKKNHLKSVLYLLIFIPVSYTHLDVYKRQVLKPGILSRSHHYADISFSVNNRCLNKTGAAKTAIPGF